MQFPTMRMSHEPGPLHSWVQHALHRDESPFSQRGREAIMPQLQQVGHMLEENIGTVSLVGFLLGTFVDKRFYLVPLAVGGVMLWRSMQENR